jgi:hypothetical protein
MTSTRDRLLAAVATVTAAGDPDPELLVGILRDALTDAARIAAPTSHPAPTGRRFWRCRSRRDRLADLAAKAAAEAASESVARLAFEFADRLGAVAVLAAELDRRDVPSLEAIGLHASQADDS